MKPYHDAVNLALAMLTAKNHESECKNPCPVGKYRHGSAMLQLQQGGVLEQ